MDPTDTPSAPLRLPEPRRTGGMPLADALAARRSARAFRRLPLPLADLAQILWAAQGLTADGKRRTVPSAGQTYPLELRVVAGDVEGLPPGLYRYEPCDHVLVQMAPGDLRPDLYDATMGQAEAADAPVTLALAAVYDRVTHRYGTRGISYALLEAGHAGQNVYLQATALGLSTVAVGAFREDVVRGVLSLTPDQHPLYLFPLGLAATP